MSLNEATFDRLKNLARQRGSITTNDLREVLPIDQMTVEDISDVITRLEEADFDLEIDPALSLPTPGIAPKAPTATSKPAQTSLPKRGADVWRQPVSSPALGVESAVKKPPVWKLTEIAPAHLLLMTLVFTIATLVLVIAWPF
jgi:Sigma-70 factor, region 1.1